MSTTDNSQSIDQIMGYLCGLTSECGFNPTFEEAKAYSRRSRSLIDPHTAVKILGVRNWDGVLAAYNRYISGKSLGIGVNPFKKNRGNHHYSREELLRILKDLYIEFDGQISQQKINERAQQIPTPAYATFVRFFGPLKNWPKVIEGADESTNSSEHITQ